MPRQQKVGRFSLTPSEDISTQRRFSLQKRHSASSGWELLPTKRQRPENGASHRDQSGTELWASLDLLDTIDCKCSPGTLENMCFSRDCSPWNPWRSLIATALLGTLGGRCFPDPFRFRWSAAPLGAKVRRFGSAVPPRDRGTEVC